MDAAKTRQGIYSVFLKIKRKFPKEFIASVPPELREQFDTLQLKNSIRRIRMLTVLMLFFKVITAIFYSGISEYLQNKESINTGDYIQFAGIVLFNLAVVFSSKKGKAIRWSICYLYIAFNLILYALGMFYSGEFFPLPHMFFISFYLFIMIADFKPKVFIPFAVLYFLSAIGILVYRNQFVFDYSSPPTFIFNIFFVTLITKILLYNSKVRTFVRISEINELNKELSSANVKLQSLSTTDELTKLDNRRSFMEYLNVVWKQNMRLNLPVAVMMIDVDYFKKYNDSLGHIEGDKALIAIAQCMKDQMKRETDFIARFGGEEFICLLPFLKKDEALYFAEKLRQSVEDMKLPHPMSEHSKYVTVSLGMAITVPDNNISQSQFLDEADKALYKAKQSGRNRVVAAAGL